MNQTTIVDYIATSIIVSLAIFLAVINFLTSRKESSLKEPVAKSCKELPEPSSPDFYDLTPQEGVMKAMDYYGVHHKDIVYAQIILETGHFKSRICNEKRNLFGLYDSDNNDYYKFDHWVFSVKAYKDLIQSRYRKGEDYYDFLKRINYAEDPKYINKLKKIVSKYEQR